MVSRNQNENENEKLNLSPLGSDEINSVIKSFKTSTFNQEEIYKKEKKNFVKKTLFDLAKESEKISSDQNESEIDVSSEDKEIDKSINVSKDIIEELDKKKDIDNTHSLSENNDNIEKEEGVEEAVSESIKSDEILEEKLKSEHNKLDEVTKENIDQNVNVSDESIVDTEPTEANKIDYEDKTLEALDSVREAVTKSLEENVENKIEHTTKNKDTSKIITNDPVNEINLINSLFKNIREISNEEIENIVKSKVIELAEEVIGYQIEKFPDKFLKKIKNSINEIKSINNDIKIHLNDKDFELLSKFIESHKTEVNFKLDLDSSLGRGDFTIDMGGVMQSIKYKKVIE